MTLQMFKSNIFSLESLQTADYSKVKFLPLYYLKCVTILTSECEICVPFILFTLRNAGIRSIRNISLISAKIPAIIF